MQKYWVYRVDISPYQGADFPSREQQMVNSLPSFHYLDRPPRLSDGPGVLITNTNTNFSQLIASEVVQAKDHVQLIIHPNSGYDNIPADWVAQEPTPPIIVGNPIRQAAVAEYSVSALFHHFSAINGTSGWEHKREWNRELLADQTILLVGLGHIGQAIKQQLAPLVKHLTIYDPFKGYSQLDLSGVRVVILAAGLNPTSHHLINREFLAKLPDNYLLINGARGGLIEQSALIDSLSANPKAYAFLDVFEQEPLPDGHPLFQLTNATITSHIAGVHRDLDCSILEFEQTILNSFSLYEGDTCSFSTDHGPLLLQNRLNNGHLI